MKRHIIPTLSVLLALMLASGCLTGGDKQAPIVMIEPNFSMNIGDVNPSWPTDVEELTEAEKEVYTKRGTPDYIHIIWSKRDTISTPMTINRIMKAGVKIDQTRKGWIYLDKKEEVIFRSPQRVETVPLSDKLDAVCKYGDPPEPTWISMPDGSKKEKWHYIAAGVVLYFVDDVLDEQKHVQPMPGYFH